MENDFLYRHTPYLRFQRENKIDNDVINTGVMLIRVGNRPGQARF